MAEYLSPGVYVEEFESGSKPMEGVGTSTAGMVGLAERGPVGGVPQLVTNFADFNRKYGGYLSASEFGNYRFLAYSVEHFFINGGSRCYISRVVPADAKCAKGAVPATSPVISIKAANEGEWANDMTIVITPASKAKTNALSAVDDSKTKFKVKKSIGFNVGDIVCFSDGTSEVYNVVAKSQDNEIEFVRPFDVSADITDAALVPSKFISTCEFNVEVKYNDVVEVYENASFNINASNYIEKLVSKSTLINVEVMETAKIALEDAALDVSPFGLLSGSSSAQVVSVSLAGGSNGTAAKVSADTFIGVDGGAGKRTGIQSFIDNDTVSIMAVPGVTEPNVQLTLVAHCEKLASRFAVLDMPENASKLDDIITHRNLFDSTYAALYHPWLQVYDPLDKKNIMLPPSGSILGVYARTDNARGVHKAPANEVVKACTGLSIPFNKGEQDILNPKGVNLIRSFPGQGIRVWGARTASSDPSWKYVNVRRLFIFLEESIKANTNWVVFEPNTVELWARVKRTIDNFLTTVWRSGALAGSSESAAFFCEIGSSTMTQEDIDNGRLICVIGVAPVKPAEFVIFRITQKTGEM